MPAWKPGESGNPTGEGAGRPKGSTVLPDIKKLVAVHVENMVTVLESIASDPKAPHPSRVAAATYLLDRTYGRPAQAIHVESQGGMDDCVLSALALLDSAVTAQTAGKGSNSLN